MEIVLLLGFADAIFRRERSDDRKCVCASQAKLTRQLMKLAWRTNQRRRSHNAVLYG